MDNLVIGASGQVGSRILENLQKRGLDALGTSYVRSNDYLKKLSLEDRQGIYTFIKSFKPKFIYLCAAMTHVDMCQTHPDLSYMINVEGVKYVGEAAKEVDAKLVLFSTDYVFDGEAGPYVESAHRNPLNVCGFHKMIAEDYAIVLVGNSLIVRTTWVYDWEKMPPGKNFVQRLIIQVLSHTDIRAPIDQIGTPTYAPDLAEETINLANKGVSGIVHLAGDSYLSRYNFALDAAKIFELNTQHIIGALTSELNQDAVRPLRAGLKSEKVPALPNHISGLSRMYERRI